MGEISSWVVGIDWMTKKCFFHWTFQFQITRIDLKPEVVVRKFLAALRRNEKKQRRLIDARVEMRRMRCEINALRNRLRAALRLNEKKQRRLMDARVDMWRMRAEIIALGDLLGERSADRNDGPKTQGTHKHL